MRPNGEVRWLHRKSEVYRNPPLREPRLLVVYEDITERMRSQLALEENIAAQQRVARALNMLAASNELISHARSVGTLVLAACEAIVSAGGYAPAWLGAVQKYAEQRVTPVAFAPGTAEAEQYVREAEVCWSDTERGRGPTGRAIRERRTIVARDTTHDPDFAPWSARAQAYGIRSSLTYPLLEDGVPIYVLMVYSGSLDAFNDDEVELLERLGANLTSGILRLRAGEARAAAEQQTQIARRELQAVMDHTIDGLITLDQSGAILAFSQPAARIFGYAREEVISAPITLLIPDYDPVLLSDTATDTLKSVGSSREVVGRRKDGGAFPIDLAIGQIPGPATERRFVWTVRDVTARKEAEQRLARARGMEALGNIASAVAHDCNNILGSVLGYAGLLLQDLKPGIDQYESAEYIHAAGKRGRLLIRQILDFAGQSAARRRPVLLADIIADTCGMLRASLPASIFVAIY